MHSIIFGWRHVLGCSICLLNLWPEGLAARIFAKWGLIAATMCAADFATRKFGSPLNRTTNAMPYPVWVSPEMQIPIKDRYVAAQFGATAMSVYSLDDGYLAFIPLIGIQSAAFCMTLVRKHKMSAAGYHLIYSASLALSGPWTLVWKSVFFGSKGHHGIALAAGLFVVMPLRLYCKKIPKELLWLLGVTLIETGYQMQGQKPVTARGAAVVSLLFVWYVAPYSILIAGPDSRLVRWSRKLHFFALYTARQNDGVKHVESRSTSSLEGKGDDMKDQGKENTSPEEKMSSISEISHSRTPATSAHMRDGANRSNRESWNESS